MMGRVVAFFVMFRFRTSEILDSGRYNALLRETDGEIA